MNQIKSRVILGLAAVALTLSGCQQVSAPPQAAPAPAAAVVKVKIIAFNDFHGNLRTPGNRVPIKDPSTPNGFRMEAAGGIEQFSALVKSLKAKNPNNAVVTAGDMVGATPLLSSLFNDEPTIEAMNLVGVDFHAVGNHEFDYGIAHLKRLANGGCKPDKTGTPNCQGRAPYAGAKFQFLAANVDETATGKTLFPPFAIKEFEGVKVGFIGLVTKTTPTIVRPGGAAGVIFQDEAKAANAVVAQLRKQGVEAFVVMIHEGGEQTGGINECVDFKGNLLPILDQFDPALNVVVSAHTHRYHVCERAGRLVTGAGSNGTLLTEIDLVLDRATGKIISRQGLNLAVPPMGDKDPALTALIGRYSVDAEPLENRIVAKISNELPTTTNIVGESQLGNMVADAHLAGTSSPDTGGAVIAFNNPGSLRAPVIPNAAGEVKYGDLFRLQPFGNDLIIMTLSGKQLKALLEQQFGEDRQRIMGVSAGFSYTYDPKRPKDDRILAETMKLNGAQIQPDLQYRIAANSFLAGGSEGMLVFRDGTERQVGMLDLEAVVAFLSANSPYTPAKMGRITRLN
jgi:5'-nucleotidase